MFFIREEETAILMRKVRESAGPVNLSEMFFEFATHVVCRSAFGWKYNDSEKVRKLVKLVEEVTELMGAICVGDFIPWLSLIDRVSGFDGKLERVAKGLDDFIEERLQTAEVEDLDGDNFLDVVLQTYKDTTVIKAIMLDVFAAGTDTSAVVLEWVMTELLANPTVMQKLQREVRDIVQQDSVITEDDLENMHFLKAVIKETFRFRPPVPLLLPRKAREDMIINGHNVSAGTTVLINYWAIGRDPKCWDEPENFKPSRFLNFSVDFRGLDFELIPFGTGRRKCPAITYSVVGIEFLLANLVHEFNWKYPEGDKLDIGMKPGVTLHKVVPLLAVATKTT